MSLPKVLPDDNGIRPAGEPNVCFYCNQKVGQPHKEECVILEKKVTVSYEFTIEIEVPYFWDKETVEFHRNLSSWCADNTIQDLEEAKKQGVSSCLCGHFHCKMLEVAEPGPYRKNKKGEVIN